MSNGQQDGPGASVGHRVDGDTIAEVFRPLLLLRRSALPSEVATGDSSEQVSDPRAPDLERNRTGHLLVAVSALWDAVLVGAGVDLDAHLDQKLMEARPDWEFNGYADGMLTYELCNSIWKWNQLGTPRPTDDLDRMIIENLSADWAEDRLELVLREILRAGIFELTHLDDIPPKVTITEYVDLAYAFYSGVEPKMVNAVLDRIAKQSRAEDMG